MASFVQRLAVSLETSASSGDVIAHLFLATQVAKLLYQKVFKSRDADGVFNLLVPLVEKVVVLASREADESARAIYFYSVCKFYYYSFSTSLHATVLPSDKQDFWMNLFVFVLSKQYAYVKALKYSLRVISNLFYYATSKGAEREQGLGAEAKAYYQRWRDTHALPILVQVLELIYATTPSDENDRRKILLSVYQIVFKSVEIPQFIELVRSVSDKLLKDKLLFLCSPQPKDFLLFQTNPKAYFECNTFFQYKKSI